MSNDNISPTSEIKSNPSKKYLSSDLIWILFITLFVFTTLFEKMMFDKVFDDLEDYLILIGAWFVGTLFMMLIGKYLSSKILTLLLLLSCSAMAIVWLFFTFQLPEAEPGSYNCTSWDCELLHQQFWTCNSWACTLPGQIIIFTAQFTIFIPIFLSWKRKLNFATKKSMNYFKPLIIMGGIFLILGVFELFIYYLVPFMVALLWLFLGGYIVLVYRNQNDSDGKNLSTIQLNAPLTLDLTRFLPDLIFLSAVAIFCFSMILGNVVLFNHFLEFGAGILLFACVSFIPYIILSTDQNQNRINMQFVMLEVLSFLILSIACIMGWGFYNSESILKSETGMPFIISGMIYCFFTIRLLMLNEGHYLHQSRLCLKIPFLKRQAFDILIISLLFLLIFAIGMIGIGPQYDDAYIAYLPAMILAVFGFLVSFIRLVRMQSINNRDN